MKKYSADEKSLIMGLAVEAYELRNEYWDKLSELESALGFDVDGFDEIIENGVGEDFEVFVEICIDYIDGELEDE
jgi:hypothetical protein